MHLPTNFEDLLQYLSHNIKRKDLIRHISNPLNSKYVDPSKRAVKDVKNFIKLFNEDVSLIDKSDNYSMSTGYANASDLKKQKVPSSIYKIIRTRVRSPPNYLQFIDL